jgi:hypothetical protein
MPYFRSLRIFAKGSRLSSGCKARLNKLMLIFGDGIVADKVK